MDYIKRFIILLFILVFSLPLNAQINTKLAPGIDENNKDFMAIFEVWKKYLENNPHTLYDNPYWNSLEKQKYKSYDLLNSHGFLKPSLYALNTSNVVLYFKKKEEYYLIYSLFYWSEKNNMNPLALTKVVAKKTPSGSFKLYNWLPIHSKQWNKKLIGKINYIYPKEYDLKISEANKANSFINKLSDLFEIDTSYIDYYIFKDCDNLFNSQGFEYIISLGTIPNKCAFFDEINKIVYTTEESGEFHRHELIHLINSKYTNAHPLLLSGLSVYTNSSNSSMGKSFLFHIKKLNNRFKNISSINLTNWNDIKKEDSITEPYYFIGAVLCDVILKRGGIDLLKEALKTGKSDHDLITFVEDCLNLTKEELNILLKKRFNEISLKNNINFLINY